MCVGVCMRVHPIYFGRQSTSFSIITGRITRGYTGGGSHRDLGIILVFLVHELRKGKIGIIIEDNTPSLVGHVCSPYYAFFDMLDHEQ